MTTATDATDDATNRRLQLLVGLVVVLGSVCVAGALAAVIQGPQPVLWKPILLACLIAVANHSGFEVRVRAVNLHLSVTSPAVLMAAIVLHDVGWLVLSTAVGMLVSKLVLRLTVQKLSYNVAKDAIAAAAVGWAVLLIGQPPFGAGGLAGGIGYLVVMPIAAVIYAVVDDLLFFPVIALATGTSAWQRFTQHWDVRLWSRICGLALALAATAVVTTIDRWLLVALPPLLYALQLASASRVRNREEREAWQRLARTTDELNAVDLDGVLRSSVRHAAELFSADEVEIEVRPDQLESRLVRGTTEAVGYDGPPAGAPPTYGSVIPTPLESHDGDNAIGELRLRFHGEVTLTEREGYTLRTFAAALCTAIRNASTHAETQRLAASHALAAAQDPLTKLANRRRLEEFATAVLDRPAKGVTALLLLDLNRFKEINDTLGHAAGDRVLIEIAQRIQGAAADSDLVTRFGGDEFAILFTALPAPPVAVPRAQAILSAIAAPMYLDGMRISVEASGGIAVADGSTDIAELLRRADVAMYQAKRRGQQVVQYAVAQDTADVSQLVLGGDLARAIDENEFVVHFQPIVDLGTAEVIAAEALTRWEHPDHGLLYPGAFLDTVERSAQLAAFGELVLD